MDKIIIAVIACHTNSHLKYHTTINNINKIYNNIKYFSIIDSKDAEYSKNLKNYFKNNKKLSIHEIINNNPLLDFGKWIYLIKNYIKKYNIIYDYILLLNDSILITDKFDNYFNALCTSNKELYAYNDSTQLGIHHYQSFLFSISKDIESKFIDFIECKKNINTYQNVIENIELKICEITKNHDCFIKIGFNKNNYGKNLIWHNESFYKDLLISKKYNIIKIKRIIEYYNNFKYSINLVTDFNEEYYKDKYNDLINVKNLKGHYKNFGFKEGRRCSKKVISFLPSFYRDILINLNILNIFDVPDEFDIFFYKKNNSSIEKLSNKECMVHYLEYGVHNNLKYL